MLFGNKAFKELFRALEAGETPILFHCSAGKDRTGVAAMLILLALGASDETICADFVQHECLPQGRDRRTSGGARRRDRRRPVHADAVLPQAGVDPAAAPYVLRSIRASVRQRGGVSGPEYGLTPRAGCACGGCIWNNDAE